MAYDKRDAAFKAWVTTHEWLSTTTEETAVRAAFNAGWNAREDSLYEVIRSRAEKTGKAV
jgi:hypothetical protein